MKRSKTRASTFLRVQASAPRDRRRIAMRLTADLAQHCAQRINPLRERELDLRGYKLGAIENLGVLRDQVILLLLIRLIILILHCYYYDY